MLDQVRKQIHSDPLVLAAARGKPQQMLRSRGVDADGGQDVVARHDNPVKINDQDIELIPAPRGQGFQHTARLGHKLARERTLGNAHRAGHRRQHAGVFARRHPGDKNVVDTLSQIAMLAKPGIGRHGHLAARPAAQARALNGELALGQRNAPGLLAVPAYLGALAPRMLRPGHFLRRDDQQLFDELHGRAHHQLIDTGLGIANQLQQRQQVLPAFAEIGPQPLFILTRYDLQCPFVAKLLSLTILHGGFLSLSLYGRQTRFSRIHQETAAFNLQLRLGHHPAAEARRGASRISNIR